MYFVHLGDISWTMRIQNSIHMMQSLTEFPLNDVARIFMPSYELDTKPVEEDVNVESQRAILARQESIKRGSTDEQYPPGGKLV